MPKIKNHELAIEIANSPEFSENTVYSRDTDTFFSYTGTHYTPLLNESMEKLIWHYTKDKYPDMNVTTSLVQDVKQQLKWCILRSTDDLKDPHIAFKDTLYDITTDKTKEHSPKVLTTFSVPYNFHDLPTKTEDINAQAPHFLQFLRTSLIYPKHHEEFGGEHDPELFNLVQEMFGYFLLNDLTSPCAFFLVGEGANGKSTLANILTDIIGEQYVSAMSMQSLTTDRFTTAHLVGKKLNICNEEESLYMKNDKFKALVTGDSLTAERKFGSNFEFKPRTKYLFCTNKLPTFNSVNYGLRRRLKIVPFNNIFTPEEQDKHLHLKVKDEIPAIVAWAILGAKRFIKNNYVFTNPPALIKALEEFENEASSAVRFIRERYKVSKKHTEGTPNKLIYSDYREWCYEVNKKPMSMYNFHRDILQVVPGIKKIRISIHGGQYYGKNLIPLPPEEQYEEVDPYIKPKEITPENYEEYKEEVPEPLRILMEGQTTKGRTPPVL